MVREVIFLQGDLPPPPPPGGVGGEAAKEVT